MKPQKHLIAGIAFLSLILLSSCGGSSDITSSAPTGNFTPTTAVPAPIPTDPGTPINNAQTYTFSSTGPGPTYLPSDNSMINTDNLLSIKVSPVGGATLPAPGYNNYYFNYNCVSMRIDVMDVGGDSAGTNSANWTSLGYVNTTTLATAQGAPNCSSAATSTSYNLNYLIKQGHGPLKLKISNLRYDFYCNMYQACQTSNNQFFYQFYGSYPAPCAGFEPPYQGLYCPMKSVFQNHTVSGNIDVSVTP